MMFTRLACALGSMALFGACIERNDQYRTTITLERLSSSEASKMAAPLLSRGGSISFSHQGRDRRPGAPVTMTIRDRRDNAVRVASIIDRADASPENAVLHFQVVRASTVGTIDPALEKMGTALREMLKYQGYELVAQSTMNSSQGRRAQQSISVGSLALQLAVRINAFENNAVDMEIDLRRTGRASLMNTNVVVPVGQTVVLGSAFPGQAGEALILTVRADRGPSRTRTASRHAPGAGFIELPPGTAVGRSAAAALHEIEELAEANEALSRDLEKIAIETRVAREASVERILVPGVAAARRDSTRAAGRAQPPARTIPPDGPR